MNELKKYFELSDEQRIQALLIESQVLMGQGNSRKAGALLEKAETLADELTDPPQLATRMDWVSALYRSGDHERGDAMLNQLLEEYGDDQKALEQLDSLLAEPVSKHNRRLVAEMNKTGIGHYEREAYSKAIHCFEHARQLFPQHPGILLNLVQSLEGQLRAQGFQSDIFQQANDVLAEAKAGMAPTHPEHPRYLQLKDMLAEHARHQR